MSNKQLQNAIECSELMLKDAEKGNWEKVFEIEIQRSKLLETLFSSASNENNIEGMDDKIKKIITINKKLETITLKARDVVHSDIASISKGRHAINSYAQNAV